MSGPGSQHGHVEAIIAVRRLAGVGGQEECPYLNGCACHNDVKRVA